MVMAISTRKKWSRLWTRLLHSRDPLHALQRLDFVFLPSLKILRFRLTNRSRQFKHIWSNKASNTPSYTLNFLILTLVHFSSSTFKMFILVLVLQPRFILVSILLQTRHFSWIFWYKAVLLYWFSTFVDWYRRNGLEQQWEGEFQGVSIWFH